MTDSPLAYRNFRLFFFDRFAAMGVYVMISLVAGQYIFEKTASPYALGWMGLVLFLPRFLFSLPAGMLADRFEKRHILTACRILTALSSAALATAFRYNYNSIPLLYALLFLLATSYSLSDPANAAIVPMLVPEHLFSKATAWGGVSFHASIILGPVLAGKLYTLNHSPLVVFDIATILSLGSLALMASLKKMPDHKHHQTISWHFVTEGLHYVFKNRIILGIISLDLFAVLFGGVVALLPIFANDILKVGAEGLGYLRAALPFGAWIMSLVLTKLPKFKNAGRALFISIGIFGLATLFFGISKNFAISLSLLFIAGASDMVSVMIRQILVQTETPPEMRGRVSAVNQVFIGASNELGEFESGITAGLFGTVPAVVIGGIGTLAVVGLWMNLFPEVRKIGKLE